MIDIVELVKWLFTTKYLIVQLLSETDFYADCGPNIFIYMWHY